MPKTNECVMCGMSIPEDEVRCNQCAMQRADEILDEYTDDEIDGVLDAMYEEQDYDEPEVQKCDNCDEIVCTKVDCPYCK